jgi:hypothetical protein
VKCVVAVFVVALVLVLVLVLTTTPTGKHHSTRLGLIGMYPLFTRGSCVHELGICLQLGRWRCLSVLAYVYVCMCIYTHVFACAYGPVCVDAYSCDLWFARNHVHVGVHDIPTNSSRMVS